MGKTPYQQFVERNGGGPAFDPPTTLVIPMVNINGTSRDALVSAYCDASEAIRRAVEAVGRTSPHGRDYIGNDVAFNNATRQHRDRVAKLQAVFFEIQSLAELTAG